MVKVIKKDGKTQPFKSGKIVKACVGSGVPRPVAESIASMITKKVKARKVIKSKEIRAMVFKVFDSVIKAKKHWMEYKKKK